MKRALFLFLLLVTTACQKQQTGRKLTVIATPVPHAEMLEFVKPQLQAAGINLVIVETEDYNLPNRSVQDKLADANFFEHQPFLDAQIEQFHYKLEAIAKVHIEPLGLYSKKYTQLSDIPPGTVIAIPNDPTNEARALDLLVQANLITLKSSASRTKATILDIAANPKKLTFREIDAPLLPRTLQEVAAAIIPTNFALQANLTPAKDALILENSSSPYVNILVARPQDPNPDLQALKESMNSPELRSFIEEHYHGAILPAF